MLSTGRHYPRALQRRQNRAKRAVEHLSNSFLLPVTYEWRIEKRQPYFSAVKVLKKWAAFAL